MSAAAVNPTKTTPFNDFAEGVNTYLFGPIGQITADLSGIQKVANLIQFVALGMGGEKYYPILQRKFVELDSMIDAFGLPKTITYFTDSCNNVKQTDGSIKKITHLKLDFTNGKLGSIVSHIFFMMADAAGALLILVEFNLINLGNAAAKVGALGTFKVLGKTPLKFIANLSLAKFATLVAAVGYGSLFIDSFHRYMDPNIRNVLKNEKGQELVDPTTGQSIRESDKKLQAQMAIAVAEFALKVLFFTGASLAVTVAVGLVAKSIGIGVMLYKQPEESDKAVQKASAKAAEEAEALAVK